MNITKPFQIVVLGESTVGKTSLVRNSIKPDIVSTVGVDFSSKAIQLPNEVKKTKIQIWDTAGQEIYKSICKNFYQKADCAIIVFELSKRRSWETVKDWFREVREYDPYMGIVLVGNKSDRVFHFTREETITWTQIWEDALEFSRVNNVKLLSTSVETGENTMEMLYDATRAARIKREKSSTEASYGMLTERLLVKPRKGVYGACCRTS